MVLSSLFGDPRALSPEEDTRFRSTLPELDVPAGGGPIVSTLPASGDYLRPGTAADRRTQELFLTGSPAEALRMHLAGQGDTGADPHSMALFDPVRTWAPALLKALSDSGGQPLDRLVLREGTHLTTLATIERTRAARRNDEMVTLYHADVPSGVVDSAAVPLVLMERAQLAVVIVGPMHPESVTGMLEMLLAATHEPSWRCPSLAFMLPPAAVWIANKVSSLGWPQPLRVLVQNESLASAAAVWTALEGIWNRVKTLPHWSPLPSPEQAAEEVIETIHVEPLPLPARAAASRVESDFAEIDGSLLSVPDAAPDPPPAVEPPPPATVLPFGLAEPAAALLGLMEHEGVLACALVDARNGSTLARELRPALPFALDVAGMASTAAQLMRAHRLAAERSGFAEPVEEVIASAGSRQQIVRRVARHPEVLLVALLDAGRSNLALARYRILQAEQALA